MTITANLMGSGCPGPLARAIIGGWATTEVGAGTTQATATLLSRGANHYIATAANNSGVILPPGTTATDKLSSGDIMVIFNADVNTLLLYPPLGGKINVGTTNASISIATLTGVEANCIDGLNFYVSGPTT